MSKSEIMSGVDLIPYDQINIMETLREEAIQALGQERWDVITAGIEMPADDMEPEYLSHLTRELLKHFDSMVDPHVSRTIFCRVKHGLKHSDFRWAREQFLKYNDIDSFCAAMRSETLDKFALTAKTGAFYHGQPVDDSVLRFVREQPYLLYGARDRNTIAAIAIPCETQKYLRESDPVKKKYYACHCQFARESLLQKEGTVSTTLCNCSLGHTKVFWEAALATELEGKVVSSVLGDGLLCRFAINLPDAIMRQYVHE